MHGSLQRQPNLEQGLRADEGQALVEYALVLMLVALVTVGALTVIGVNVSTAISNMAAGL
jgi:pilus assembly protein Flp/PilA